MLGCQKLSATYTFSVMVYIDESLRQKYSLSTDSVVGVEGMLNINKLILEWTKLVWTPALGLYL